MWDHPLFIQQTQCWTIHFCLLAGIFFLSTIWHGWKLLLPGQEWEKTLVLVITVASPAPFLYRKCYQIVYSASAEDFKNRLDISVQDDIGVGHWNIWFYLLANEGTMEMNFWSLFQTYITISLLHEVHASRIKNNASWPYAR